MNKRNFLKSSAAVLATPLLGSFDLKQNEYITPLSTLKGEALWKRVRQDYHIKEDYINLESGYYNIIPTPTLSKVNEHLERVNREGSYYMRNQLDIDRKKVTEKLAELVGCNANDLAITRNTTESLDLVISGFPWEVGDHAIYAEQDYGAMQLMFEQISKRHGIHLDVVSVPNHPKDDDEIVALYESKITSKTKLIMVCHMINITGQILPIRKICDMAHSHGVEVLVDGAHCVGHFDFKITDLNCDYYGSSLHKWLAAPLGNGLLYIKDDHRPKIWPLLADYEKDLNQMRRLNHLGTHPAYITLGVPDAIDYLNDIGIKRKEQRLNQIRQYWMKNLQGVENIQMNTPWSKERACGIANVGLRNMKPSEMAKRLFDEFNVFTVAIDYANVQGCRITPNVFTTFDELDRFSEAVIKLAKV
ncbi:MAG: aminotransferase [Bacteroidetes bacterium]|nr:MAG: aminotransferase [Bacteroidota bacterium]